MGCSVCGADVSVGACSRCGFEARTYFGVSVEAARAEENRRIESARLEWELASTKAHNYHDPSVIAQHRPLDPTETQAETQRKAFDEAVRAVTDNKLKSAHIMVTRDLAVALVARNGGFLLFPQLSSFASDSLVARIAYQTAGDSICQNVPRDFLLESVRVSGPARYDTGGRGRVAKPVWKKNPTYIKRPISWLENREISKTLKRVLSSPW